MWRAQTPAELSSLPTSAVGGGCRRGEYRAEHRTEEHGAVDGLTISALRRANNQVIPLETPTTSPTSGTRTKPGSEIGVLQSPPANRSGHRA